MNPSQGVALLCDREGTVKEILHNPAGLGLYVHVGMPFTRMASGGSLAKALSFLLYIRETGAAFDWEIDVTTLEGIKTLRFFGSILGEQILIVGSEDQGIAQYLYDELLRMSNEQTNNLRAAFKQLSGENSLYDEISRLNNELVTLQRELAKQNAELERMYAQARRAAILDPLTNIYNRRGFFELGERELQRAIRYDRPLSVIMFDLDFFKRLNDTYGHAAGDHALEEVSARCSRTLRKVDIFGRYGGEEFVVLLPETNMEDAQIVAERLRQAALEPIRAESQTMSVTLSLGLSERREDIKDLDEFLRRADHALYQAKEAGRNCIRMDGR